MILYQMLKYYTFPKKNADMANEHWSPWMTENIILLINKKSYANGRICYNRL